MPTPTLADSTDASTSLHSQEATTPANSKVAARAHTPPNDAASNTAVTAKDASPTTSSWRSHWWIGLVVPLGLLLLWDALVRFGLFQPYQLPYPATVVETLWSMAVAGKLHEHVLITLQRVGLGFSFGTGGAVLLGSLVGTSSLADRLLDGTIQALRNIPSLAWVPLFILWFGVGEMSKVTLIALGTFFPVYLNLVDAIQGIDRKLIEVGRVHGLSRWGMTRRIIFPATLPGLLVGIRGGIGLGWMFVVAAELIAASKGLGFLMSDGRVMARPDIVIASILLFAFFGQLSDVFVRKIQERVLHWQDRASL